MASSASGASLPALFRDASATLKKLDDGEINIRDKDFAQTMETLISQFKQCLALIEANSLFSSNEEVDDVTTAHLKYVLVPFKLALAYMKVMDIQKRGAALKAAKALMKNFLRSCTNLGLVGEKEVDMYIREGNPSAEQLRDEKLERARARTELEAKLQAVEKIRGRAGAVGAAVSSSALDKEIGGAKKQQEEAYDDEDEHEREFWILLIELGIKTALDELSMLDREIEILSHMAMIQKYGKDVVEAKLPPPKPGWEGVMTPEGPLKTFVIDKKLNIRKATFRPHWNQPTMTVEEAGEIEAAIAMENSRKQAAAQAEAEKHKLTESDEENDDEALKAARDWDQFKDDNPTGSGNTYNKGYIY